MQDFQIKRHIKYRDYLLSAGGASTILELPYDDTRYAIFASLPSNNAIYLQFESHIGTFWGFSRIENALGNDQYFSFEEWGQMIWRPLRVSATGVLDVIVSELYLDTQDASLLKYLKTEA
jgi:hypothetical protein